MCAILDVGKTQTRSAKLTVFLTQGEVPPGSYLTLPFAQLPHAASVEDFEALLPWNARLPLLAVLIAHSHKCDKGRA